MNKLGKIGIGLIIAAIVMFFSLLEKSESYYAFILLGAGFVCIAIDKAKENNTQTNTEYRNYEKRYLNKCWKCGAPIDSRKNKKCSKCGKYYICDECGACLCDSPLYNKENKYW